MTRMGSNEEHLVSKPPPPPNLSKEHVGIWTGWCCKGDREVAREAAAKGIDIKLVLVWVRELLDRKQIFRVCHVLKNIEVDPEEELVNVFYTTTNKDLREYIGNHLKKLDKLDDNISHLWRFLELILNNNVLISKYREKNKSAHLDLIFNFRKLTSSFNDETVLCDNIVNVAKFLCNNLVDFFSENPLILLSLLLFTKDIKFLNILNEKSLVILDEQLFECVSKIMQNFKVLTAICNKVTNGENCNLSFYDLLERHLNIDVKDLYSFQFEDTSMPHFNSPNLVQSYGYSKQINYLLYIKELRPSIAAKLFMVNEFKCHNGLTEESVKLAQKKIYKLALRNLHNIETTSSCIAFLEMIGSDAFAILKLLETAVIAKIDFEDIIDASSFIDAMKLYDLVVKFAILYNVKLPNMFLNCCASNNMWLPFLIFAQIHNYPVDQIKITLQSLKNPNLLEHVNHSVIHDIQIDERNNLMRERDSRTYFLSRIGVHKSIDSLNQSESVQSSITSQTSYGSATSSAGSDFFEIDLLNTKATLLQTLIRCHNSTDPPRALLQACQLYRNPLLAILATSYEENPLYYFADFLNFCISLNFDAVLLTLKLDAFKNALDKCRRYSVQTEYDHELTYLSNKIWIETTALLLLASAIEYNITSLYNQIQFLQILCDVNIEKYISCPNIQNVLNILRNICESKCHIRFNIGLYFDGKNGRKAVVDCINKLLDHKLFETATKIAQIEGLPLDLILIKEWQHKYEHWDHSDINFWENSNEQLSTHNITADCVVEFYLNYSNKAQNKFEKYQLLKLANEWASKFDLSCKYEIERKKWLAYIVLEDKQKGDNYSIFNEQTSFRNCTYKEMLEMLQFVKPYEEEITSDSSNLLQQLVNKALIEGYFWLALKLEKMFGCKCSDLNILKLCFSLAEGILNPYQLNTEQRLLLNTGTHFRSLSHRRTFLSSRLSSLSSASLTHTNVSLIQTAEVVDGVPVQDTLALLYILAEKLTNGGEIAYKIFMTYRISLNIEIPYHVIVSNTDYMKMLRDAIEDDCMHKLDVVHDFIRVYKWSKDEYQSSLRVQSVWFYQKMDLQKKACLAIILALIMEHRNKRRVCMKGWFKTPKTSLMQVFCATSRHFKRNNIKFFSIIADFICEEIVNAASNYVKSKSDDFLMWNLKMDQEFHLVLQLLQDNCSLLGYKIYSYASTIHKAQVSANLDFKISELALVVELLITAHNCFTADCNMEGISVILKKCQMVISHLLILRSWKLIVRLLTGVARYTEMNYVFQILREHDQFEFLLRKGSRKDNGLKVALLDYLKKYCPDNRELYKIVALHFTLFSEVALLWEREAQSVIRNLIAISKLEMQNNRLNPDTQPFVLFTNTDGTRICLNKVIENYTHATEFHLQGEKLAKAMNSAKQAELIALQTSLLKALPNKGTTSRILVQAYSYQPDWATVLYEQCITQNNNTYLCDFLKHLSLTDALVHDISRKFLNANINTPNEINSMKNLLNKLPSVHTKYRIASELGFTDLVEDLITKGQLAYLKDTVWKKGYKN
ncbi:hypothetical protein NQ314_019857 [Rhamnusium bicolor]|uniref:Spatacsin C-terminal domain-containing protein n=1 Tax=Rhamnusium bicolor TaxID=1586634 RepID=A0AAV8WLL8_9CUCU|nr:hypothetical protein NQ314_019857 [Rhamnusium bicolor]